MSVAEGMTCPGATARTSSPALESQDATELNFSSASSSLMGLSGVTEPFRPLIVIVEFFWPVSANCGLKVTVIVLVAPGVDRAWPIF